MGTTATMMTVWKVKSNAAWIKGVVFTRRTFQVLPRPSGEHGIKGKQGGCVGLCKEGPRRVPRSFRVASGVSNTVQSGPREHGDLSSPVNYANPVLGTS